MKNRRIADPLVVGVVVMLVGWSWAFWHFFDVPIALRVKSAVEKHVKAEELGAPQAVCTREADCYARWSCEDRHELFAARESDERVYAFKGAGVAVFFVLVDDDGTVKQAARCAS